MKNKKIIDLLKIGILSFGIFLLITGCEKENLDIDTNTKLSIKLVNASNIFANNQLQSKIQVFSEQKNSNYSRETSNDTLKFQEITSTNILDFQIVTDYAKQIEINDYNSYTFVIQRDFKIDSIQENLLLSLQSDGTYKEFLIWYYTDEETFSQIDDSSTFENMKVKFIDLDLLKQNLGIAARSESDPLSGFLAFAPEGCYEPVDDCSCLDGWAFQPCGTGDGSNSSGDNGSNGNLNVNNGGFNDASPNSNTGGGGLGNTNITTGISMLALYQNWWMALSDEQQKFLDSKQTFRTSILSFLNQNQYSSKNQRFANNLTDVIRLDTSIDDNALNFISEALKKNKIYNNFDYSFFNSINQYTSINTSASNPGYIQLQIYFTTKCAVLKYNNPTWSESKIYWEASKDFVHIALDGFGMIPVVGEIADLTNGVLYLIEGDGINATLSFAATIPIVGWGSTAGKYVFKITASTLGTKVRLTWKVLANGTVYFGSSGSKLRKVLGITDATKHAHHLIPWARREHDLVQKAAKSGSIPYK